MTAMILWAKKKTTVWRLMLLHELQKEKAAYLTRHRLHCFSELPSSESLHATAIDLTRLITLLPNRYILLSCMGDMHLPFDCDDIIRKEVSRPFRCSRLSFFSAAGKEDEDTDVRKSGNFKPARDGRHRPIVLHYHVRHLFFFFSFPFSCWNPTDLTLRLHCSN